MTTQYIMRRMSEQIIKTKVKVMKSWRLDPNIVKAIKKGARTHGYRDETAYVEAIFRRVLGLPEPPEPTPPQINKQAMDLRV